MNNNPEDKKRTKDFYQTDLISTREVTWKIRNFISVPKTANDSLDSPPFDFENATWCLRLYPCANEDNDIGFKIVRLSSRVPHRRLQYNLLWPDGCDGVFSQNIHFSQDVQEYGVTDFVVRAFSWRYTTHIDEIKILTLTCQISCYRLPVADAFCQTERETRISGTGGLCQNFKNLVRNGQDSDLVFKVKDKEFCAHQNILRVRSPAFETILSHDTIEKNSGVIDIPDCDPGAFEQFLLYIYSGEVETLDAGNMLALYFVSDKYDTGYLKEKCREFIKNSLTFSNVSDVIQLALNHSDANLLECATDYFVKHVNAVLRTVEWQSFAKRNTIQANELIIKAADDWKAGKDSHSENLNDKNFYQIDLMTREITWVIRNFQSLPKSVGYSLDSPPFDFENATWCLRLYPYVQETHMGFTIVRLRSRVPRHRLNYNLIWPDEYHVYHSVEDEFDENHKENGDMAFFNRSFDVRYATQIDKIENLELMCQISSYGSPVVHALSQTEQDTKSIEDLCQHFKKSLLNGKDHNLVLKVKNKEFRAHQNILRARSPVLDSMLSHDMIERNSGVIDIPDCDPGAFEQFLLYIYSGEVETLDAGNMLALYFVSDKYDMGHLKEQCREFIKSSLTSCNVSDVIQFALNHSDAHLLEYATDYFVQNVHMVLRTVEWQSFVKHNPTEANSLFIKAADSWAPVNFQKGLPIAQ